MISPFLPVLFLVVSTLAYSSGPTCLSPSGSFREWWVMYKLPKVQDGTGSAPAGTAFAYADKYSSLSISSSDLTDSSNPLGQTLNQIFRNSSQNYFMWNDDTPPGHKSSKNGHSKGTVALNEHGGFYLLHSTPRFPEDPKSSSSYSFPDDETIYGQHFLCISSSVSDINNLAKALQYARPQIYSSRVSSVMNQYAPNIAPLLSGSYINEASTTSLTFGGWSYYVKTSKWGKDFWEDLIAEEYSQGFSVETWRRPPVLDSYCSPSYSYDVTNVCTVSISGNSWAFTKDHSKWGISKSSNVICFGDINRMASQEDRAGGAMCRSVSDLHSSFSSLIASQDSCSRSMMHQLMIDLVGNQEGTCADVS